MIQRLPRTLSIGLLALPFTTHAQLSVDDAVRAVENGLGPAVHLVGDTTWNIMDRMAHYGVPGVSIAVVYDGRIAWTRQYGVVDRDTRAPVTDATLFQVASISKPVTTYAAFRMAEAKQLDLDQDINAQLRTWKLPENELTRQHAVTPRMLLGHVAGTTVHGFLGYAAGEPIPTLVQVLGGLPPANSPAVVVDVLPGSRARYSGGGYCVMQQLMMERRDTTFPALMDELVLRPLGMAHSTFEQPLSATRAPRAASGYLPDGSPVQGRFHAYPEMAPAGLWSTAADLARFLVEVQRTRRGEPGTLLSKASVDVMLSPYHDDQAGVGFGLEQHRGATYFGHGGWNEGFSSRFVAHRDKGLGVVVLTNANQPGFVAEVVRAVARTYAWPGYVPVHTPLPAEPAALEGLVGRYRTDRDAVLTVGQQGGRLFRQAIGDAPDELFRIGDSTWVGRADARPVRFKRTTDGTLELVLQGRRDEALRAYEALRAQAPDDPAIDEARLNRTGYLLLAVGQVVPARDLFFINMQLYPASANVYDSYAEACLKNGEKELALVHYKKALSMAPGNTNAARIIAELEGK